MQVRNPLLAISLYCVITLFLASCINSRKIDKWVDKKFRDESTVTKKQPDYLTISTGLTTTNNNNSTTKRTTYKVLPLFFYWQWHYAHTCSLNANIPVNNFTNTVITYGNSKGLKRKLNGKRLELTIDRLPNAFALDDKGWMVFVLLAYFGNEAISVQPVMTDMVVSYKVLQDGAEAKQGQIMIPDANKGFYLKMFNSTKRKTWEYIDNYNQHITQMSRQVVDQLLTELE